MRKIIFTVGAAVIAAGVAGGASAQTTATATATYEVKAINEVTVSGNPAALIISTGAGLAGVDDISTTWSVTTNETSKKITGQINTAMPTGMTLKVNLTAPSVGTSAGAKDLAVAAVDLVTGLTQVQGTGLGVKYTFSALLSHGVVPSASRTVTYTITNGV